MGEVKIICQINTYNSEEYIEYVLKSIYDFADKIVIIDGAFNDRMHTPFSSDRTVGLIADFVNKYDLENGKITFEQGAEKNQLRQRNKIFQYTNGYDWLMIVDDDEVYKKIHLKKLRKFLETAKNPCYKIKSFNFVNCFYWMYETANMRLWKITKGMNYFGPNSIAHNRNRSYYDKNLAETIPCIIRFHYSYVRDCSRLKIKKVQISRFQKGEFPWKTDGMFYIRDAWKKKLYRGKHPRIMRSHPNFKKEWEPEDVKKKN